jgi:hypothetical protein
MAFIEKFGNTGRALTLMAALLGASLVGGTANEAVAQNNWHGGGWGWHGGGGWGWRGGPGWLGGWGRGWGWGPGWGRRGWYGGGPIVGYPYYYRPYYRPFYPYGPRSFPYVYRPGSVSPGGPF